MNQESGYSCRGNPCSSITSGGVDICVEQSDCKVRADITVERLCHVLIWGYVADCSGHPVCGVPVKLMKCTDSCGTNSQNSYCPCADCRCTNLQELCHTCTDSCGYYQFDLDHGCEGRYRVVVCQIACAEPCRPVPDPSTCTCQPAQIACYPRRQQSVGCRSTSRSNVQYC